VAHQAAPHNPHVRLPLWLRKKIDLSSLHDLKTKLRCSGLSTVCEEARCPNIGECFRETTATFLILGDVCTRNCGFCSVSRGTPGPLKTDEPSSVARTVRDLGLRHVVITSVTRDDLPDKGASVFASIIRAVRDMVPGCTIEVLTPDFSGNQELLEFVLREKPDVFAHNVETVGRLYPAIRPGFSLARSLEVLMSVKKFSPDAIVKSGFMVGLGESDAEVVDLMTKLKDSGCDVVTIGQYLQPAKQQVPVKRYWETEQYIIWSNLAKSLGIGYCMAGPFIRSSYRAREVLQEIRAQRHNKQEVHL